MLNRTFFSTARRNKHIKTQIIHTLIQKNSNWRVGVLQLGLNPRTKIFPRKGRLNFDPKKLRFHRGKLKKQDCNGFVGKLYFLSFSALKSRFFLVIKKKNENEMKCLLLLLLLPFFFPSSSLLLPLFFPCSSLVLSSFFPCSSLLLRLKNDQKNTKFKT